MPEPEIHKVTITITQPKGGDPGQVTFGYYTIDGDLLTNFTPGISRSTARDR